MKRNGRQQKIETIRRVLLKSGIRKAYLFGSFARKERGYKDIDIAIDPPEHFSLMDMAGVLVELEDGLGLAVDLVTVRSMNPRMMEYVRKDMTLIV